jgi:stage II sporulation protein R
MKKMCGMLVFCFLVAASFWGSMLLGDRKLLNEELIRLHVVANSDSDEDQAVKLQVRDAVIASISEDLANIGDFESAEAYIRENLPKIQQVANDTLEALGCGDRAVATLQEELFDKRIYDTFSLPAGLYEALRITIGSGEGKNWWCVAFPTLCIPATSEGFEDVAVSAGFSETLTRTLEGEYEIRFYIMDLLGKLEGILWKQGN